jgi:hypothetical protein
MHAQPLYGQTYLLKQILYHSLECIIWKWFLSNVYIQQMYSVPSWEQNLLTVSIKSFKTGLLTVQWTALSLHSDWMTTHSAALRLVLKTVSIGLRACVVSDLSIWAESVNLLEIFLAFQKYTPAVQTYTCAVNPLSKPVDKFCCIISEFTLRASCIAYISYISAANCCEE